MNYVSNKTYIQFCVEKTYYKNVLNKIRKSILYAKIS